MGKSFVAAFGLPQPQQVSVFLLLGPAPSVLPAAVV